jgi:hypothetical protein
MQIIRDGHSVRIIVGPNEEALLAKMAAAEALYEALKRALNFIENTEDEWGMRLDSGDEARAALRLARGEKNDG